MTYRRAHKLVTSVIVNSVIITSVIVNLSETDGKKNYFHENVIPNIVGSYLI